MPLFLSRTMSFVKKLSEGGTRLRLTGQERNIIAVGSEPKEFWWKSKLTNHFMSQINYIIYKLKEFESKNLEKPTRIILGRETYYSFIKDARSMTHMFCSCLTPHGEVFGLRISLSKRPNYVRIMPAKLKYRFLKRFYKKYTISDSFPAWGNNFVGY